MFKIRFNLSAGENFMKWKVTSGKEVRYLDPKEVTLNMYECRLRNHKSTAKKIHEGSHKEICAWIECKYLSIGSATEPCDSLVKVSYNPKVVPYWNDCGNNVDGKKYQFLTTVGRSVCRVLLNTKTITHFGEMK